MRSASIAFALLFSAASLSAQHPTSPTQFIAPPSSEGCPVVFSADRLSAPGLRQAQTDQQSKQRPQVQQMMALHQQLVELEAKRNEAAAKLAALPPGGDPATTLQLSNQVKALDAELSTKRVELSQLSVAIGKDQISNNSGNPVGQNVQISFKQSPSAIVGVDLTVHGVTMSAHMTPAAQPSRESELSEVFHLSGSAGEPVLESALSTQRPMIITSVELSRIEYASGAFWQKSSTSRCSAAPSLFVLVDR
jgi:hypothetical protein